MRLGSPDRAARYALALLEKILREERSVSEICDGRGIAQGSRLVRPQRQVWTLAAAERAAEKGMRSVFVYLTLKRRLQKCADALFELQMLKTLFVFLIFTKRHQGSFHVHFEPNQSSGVSLGADGMHNVRTGIPEERSQ